MHNKVKKRKERKALHVINDVIEIDTEEKVELYEYLLIIIYTSE